MDLIIKGTIGPGERLSARSISCLAKSLLRGALFKHANEAYELLIDLLKILFIDLFMSDGFPEK